MKLAWSLLAVLLALPLQSGLTLLAPDLAAIIDPFLLITLYVTLTRGETSGMLVGAFSAWIEEAFFGGRVLGLLGLVRVLVAYVAGQAGRRFLFVSYGAYLVVIVVAFLAEGFILGQVASLFDVPLHDPSTSILLRRAGLNAVCGAAAFRLLDRQRRAEQAP